MSVRILIGDCRERLKELPDNSVDSVVCDPPYHLTSIVKRFGSENAAPAKVGKTGAYARASKGFMGQTWDGGDVAFQPETWAEVMRVLKPGGHLVAFSGTRTYHRMAVAIEDAGFEVRDMLSWLYGSGFPKSLDVSKAIDKAAGAEREVVGTLADIHPRYATARKGREGYRNIIKSDEPPPLTAPATDAAREWQGWGTALKPACEPICLARKPLSEKSVAANVLKWGTGAINVDACRIGTDVLPEMRAGQAKLGTFERTDMVTPERIGRWPANVCHDGSDEVVARFPDAKGAYVDANFAAAKLAERKPTTKRGVTSFDDGKPCSSLYTDSGSAARFFYCAKAATEERGEGNNHPTVKPIALMEWLVKLVTPKGGTVLDPFMGSGSTALACDRLQFAFIGCELSSDYAEIAASRLRAQAGMFANISLEMCGPETRAA